ncbi:hypothetical protein [Streptomyces sp. DT18]
MPNTDPWGQGVQLMSNTDAPDIPKAVSDLAAGTIPKGVLSFASASARGATLAGAQAPFSGMLTWLRDVRRLDLYDGGTWWPVYYLPSETTVNVSLVSWSVNVDSWIDYRSGVVTLRMGTFQRQSSAAGATADTRLPVLIPDAYRHPTRNIYGTSYQTGGSPGRFTIYSKIGDQPGQVWLTQHAAIAVGDWCMPQTITWTIG